METNYCIGLVCQDGQIRTANGIKQVFNPNGIKFAPKDRLSLEELSNGVCNIAKNFGRSY